MAEYDRNGRRGKPQREIYTPGSGPLKKTKDEGAFQHVPKTAARSTEITKIAEELKKINLSGDGKVTEIRRKPGSEVYVPKQVRESEENSKGDKSSEKPRRRDKKRRDRPETDKFTENKTPLPFRAHDDGNRFTRLGSEPRFPPKPEDRPRDTRSVEPGGSYDRYPARPPAGYLKRASAPKIDVPPRFQKKFQAELQEDSWALGHSRRDIRTQTLPNPPRRLYQAVPNEVKSERFLRSMTPEKVDRGYGDSGQADRGRHTAYDGEEKENQETKYSEPRETHANDEVAKTAAVLDWAEEVEQSEKLALSRANSKESIVESIPSLNRSGERKKKKKKRRNERDRQENRSASRERPLTNDFRRNSVDNTSNHSRNNSLDRSWRNKHPEFSRSRQSSYCDSRSRQSSFCDQSSRQNSPDHLGRIRKNSNCDSRSRQSSSERKGRGRIKTSPRLEETNWRLEQTPAREKDRESKQAGIIVLPQPLPHEPPPMPKYPTPIVQRKLFDPSNPNKPIVVPSTRSTQEIEQNYLSNGYNCDAMMIAPNDQLYSQTPLWYNPYKENFQQSHNPQLIRGIAQADNELQFLLSTGEIIGYWDRMQQLRCFLRESLKRLLVTDLRFCQAENVEQHLWKILYYNVIELLRKLVVDKPQGKDKFKMAMLTIVEEGLKFYEQLLKEVEDSNKIEMESFLNVPSCVRESLGFPGLALIAAQKIYLCLGDLARYREEANETCNYGIARQWYIKAHQINPKNGRPYNQLAILAMYTKRKLDAVYYYMRCLMSSNPMLTARESLISLFDDNRRKFEAVDRRRKDERAQREREKMKEKEGVTGYRREIWIHPGGGKNVHRTTSTCQPDVDSGDEQLYSSSSADIMKMFCMSYLHVHGKIFTKIGLESLTETALQMLKEFRALLQHSPLPLDSTKLLQLISLNMFAVEISQPKTDMSQESDGVYRSAVQESALVISLQMFNLLLERFLVSLQEHTIESKSTGDGLIPPDCGIMLPALKVWCDWMTTHVEVWNPPPSCQDLKVGPNVNCWTRIANLVTILEKMNFPKDIIVTKEEPGLAFLYLPEDATLSGFTPLMATVHESFYVHTSVDLELAQTVLRLQKIIFFGSIFLCGLDPPILKVHKVLETGENEYISVKDNAGSHEECKDPLTAQSEGEVMESMSSSEESDDSGKATGADDDDGSEIQSLIARKTRLERQARRLQAKKNTLQKVLMAEVMTEMEVRPHDLVPDTNCFIECLPQLENLLKLLSAHKNPYVVMVPLVVVNELEGLSRGCKPSQSAAHSVMVRETARLAINLLQNRQTALRCVTTRGTILNSSTFTMEEDSGLDMKNDDKILTTCINLSKNNAKDEIKEGGKRKLYRNVVLLTDDRSLRLKAISRDMPVRSLPDFMKWAGLG